MLCGHATQRATDLVLMVLLEEVVCGIIGDVVTFDEVSAKRSVARVVTRNLPCRTLDLRNDFIDE